MAYKSEREGRSGHPGRSTTHVNKSSVRVLEVLSAFGRGKTAYGVADLSHELGMTKNMVFRALRTLVEEGLLVRDETGTRYELGFGVLELRNVSFDDPDIRVMCRPYMERMHRISGVTVALQIPVGYSHVTIDGIEGRGEVLTRVARGIPVPLHISPASRAILAFLSDKEIADYIQTHSPLEKFTATSITDPDKLWEEIKSIRSCGYARGYKDHFPDVQGIAFPVLDVDQRPHGAITVVGPEEIFPSNKLNSLIPQLKAISDELNGITRLYHASPIIGH